MIKVQIVGKLASRSFAYACLPVGFEPTQEGFKWLGDRFHCLKTGKAFWLTYEANLNEKIRLGEVVHTNRQSIFVAEIGGAEIVGNVNIVRRSKFLQNT